jgi:predicted nucleotidyltransferase
LNNSAASPFNPIPMDLYPDFKEFLQFLNEEKVEYLVGGGYAVTFHGYPRYTGDIDIWIHATAENAERMMKVLERFGAGSVGITVDDFLNANFDVLKMGNEPIRIDMMTKMKGLEFPKAYQNRITESLEGIPVNFLHLGDLITAKQASNRAKDQNDLEHLPPAEA